MSTLRSLCSEYILTHDLAESTSDQYHRVVGVFCSWNHGDPPLADFTGNRISEFLLAKQQAGLSSFYRRSLRNSLVSLLRFAGKSDRVRPVKLDELEPESWTPSEVNRLIAACDCLQARRRRYWQTLIAAAYYTGLSQCDLHRLRRSDFDSAGVVRIRRRKTKRRATAAVPLELLATLPDGDGLIWPLTTSGEAFRATFRRIVRAAGLTGSFKKLRKTAGTEAEKAFPGCGHQLLANSRKVFEQHYLSCGDRPLIAPPPLPPGPDRAA